VPRAGTISAVRGPAPVVLRRRLLPDERADAGLHRLLVLR